MISKSNEKMEVEEEKKEVKVDSIEKKKRVGGGYDLPPVA